MILAKYAELDAVVLLRDRPEVGLRTGDLGTIVHVNASDSFEVEFIDASGATRALLPLRPGEVRRAGPEDRLAVRPDREAAGLRG